MDRSASRRSLPSSRSNEGSIGCGSSYPGPNSSTTESDGGEFTAMCQLVCRGPADAEEIGRLADRHREPCRRRGRGREGRDGFEVMSHARIDASPVPVNVHVNVPVSVPSSDISSRGRPSVHVSVHVPPNVHVNVPANVLYLASAREVRFRAIVHAESRRSCPAVARSYWRRVVFALPGITLPSASIVSIVTLTVSLGIENAT